MKRSILMSLLVIGAAVSLIGAASLAQLHDEEVSSGNTFAGAELDLDVNDENPLVSKLIDVGPVKPSDSGEVTIFLHTVGDIDAEATIHVANLADNDNGCNEPEREAEVAAYGVGNATCDGDPDGELSQHVGVVVWQDLDCDNVLDDGTDGEKVYFDGKLIDLESHEYSVGTIKPSVDKCIGFQWHVQDADDPETPADESNIIQTDISTFDLEFAVTQ